MIIDDHTLVAQAQRGDRDAFAELYDRYSRKIYTFLYYQCLHREAAEDLTATVFTKAMAGLSKFTPRGEGAFKAWLYRIARTTAMDYFRSRPHEQSLEGIDVPERVASAKRIEAQADLAKAVEALQTLPQLQRDIVTMRVWDDLSYKEIAVIVGKSEGNCKVIFSRSITALREQLSLAALLLFLTHHL